MDRKMHKRVLVETSVTALKKILSFRTELPVWMIPGYIFTTLKQNNSQAMYAIWLSKTKKVLGPKIV